MKEITIITAAGLLAFDEGHTYDVSHTEATATAPATLDPEAQLRKDSKDYLAIYEEALADCNRLRNLCNNLNKYAKLATGRSGKRREKLLAKAKQALIDFKNALNRANNALDFHDAAQKDLANLLQSK